MKELDSSTLLTKVILNLSDGDKANANFIHEELGVQSKAHVVSIGLSLLKHIVNSMKESHTDLLLRYPDGTCEKIIISELESYKKRLKDR